MHRLAGETPRDRDDRTQKDGKTVRPEPGSARCAHVHPQHCADADHQWRQRHGTTARCGFRGNRSRRVRIVLNPIHVSATTTAPPPNRHRPASERRSARCAPDLTAPRGRTAVPPNHSGHWGVIAERLTPVLHAAGPPGPLRSSTSRRPPGRSTHPCKPALLVDAVKHAAALTRGNIKIGPLHGRGEAAELPTMLTGLVRPSPWTR